jgi:hypothetical protein
MIRASEPPMKLRRGLDGIGGSRHDFILLRPLPNLAVAGIIIRYEKYRMSEIKSSPIPRPLSSPQIRAARALLRWSAEDLARASSVGLATIRRAELAEHRTSMTAPNDAAIRRALESAGVEFIDENGNGPGVRLRKRPQKKG